MCFPKSLHCPASTYVLPPQRPPPPPQRPSPPSQRLPPPYTCTANPPFPPLLQVPFSLLPCSLDGPCRLSRPRTHFRLLGYKGVCSVPQPGQYLPCCGSTIRDKRAITIRMHWGLVCLDSGALYIASPISRCKGSMVLCASPKAMTRGTMALYLGRKAAWPAVSVRGTVALTIH